MIKLHTDDTIFPRITQFAGESFSTRDNVRTVYAGQEEDSVKRLSRTIVLVGPIGAGKSSFIDFLCNYFYGVRFDSPLRYKIANERFDSSTPEKAVTKYIFNGTQMLYQPVVIDTPGIGDPTGLKADRELASVVRDYFHLASKERVHAVGFVLPSFMHSVNPQIDSDIKLTLSLFPDWMDANIIPIITYSSNADAANLDLLHHFDLAENTRFCVDTSVMFETPAADLESWKRQQSQWQLTTDSVDRFLKFVGDLRPQTINRRLLSGEATPNLFSPNAATSGPPACETTTSEDVQLTKAEQISDLAFVWSGATISVQETDEQISVREVTVITERVPDGQPSPIQSQKSPTTSAGQSKPEVLSQSSPTTLTQVLAETKSNKQPADTSGQRLDDHQQQSLSNQQAPQHRRQSPKPHRGQESPGIRSKLTHHRSDMHLYPTEREELTESSNLELLRRYIYDPASRTYKIQYVHEVSTRASQRSSGRQSLHTSATDIHQYPSNFLDDRPQIATSSHPDDSLLGTLADELRRQGQYDDEKRLARNTSAPHLSIDYEKENARHANLDYSPETLRRLLGSYGQSLDRRALRARGSTQISTNRPTIIRKPYDSASQSIQTSRGQLLQPLSQNLVDASDEYANRALQQAREQRSASHAVEAVPLTLDRSFDDKERIFERSERARQSFYNSSLRRGGVRHAIATRPDTDCNDNWDVETVGGIRRNSTGGGGPGIGAVPSLDESASQPRPVATQSLRSTLPALNDGKRVRPTDLVSAQLRSPTEANPLWSIYPIQKEGPPHRDLESGNYRSEDDRRPLRSDKTSKFKQRRKDARGQPKNRKLPSFTKCCFYVCAPSLVICVVAAIIITLIIIA